MDRIGKAIIRLVGRDANVAAATLAAEVLADDNVSLAELSVILED
jgi:hypothetical protein